MVNVGASKGIRLRRRHANESNTQQKHVGPESRNAQSMKNVRVLHSGKNNRTGKCPKRTTQVIEVQHVVTEVAAQHDNAEVANRSG